MKRAMEGMEAADARRCGPRGPGSLESVTYIVNHREVRRRYQLKKLHLFIICCELGSVMTTQIREMVTVPGQ